MFATATLTAHRGATLVSRDDLARYEPPEPEGRWKPVKHSLIVDLMREELARRNIPTTSFESALGFSPLFVREIRPMITLLHLGDRLQHVSHRILA